MKILSYLFFFLCLFSVSSFAQTQKHSAQETEQKPSDLIKLAAFLPSDCFHAGQFQQAKKIKGMSAPLITLGAYIFDCQQGLIWQTNDPIVESIIYPIANIPLMIKAGDKIEVLDGKVHKTLGKILNNLIGGDTSFIDKNFSIASNDSGFLLTPKSRRLRKFIRNISMLQNESAVTITIAHSDEESTQIQLFGKRTLQKIDSSRCATLALAPISACAALYKQVL